MKISLLFFFYLLTFMAGHCQDNHSEKNQNEYHGNKGASRLTLGLGHSHVSEGKVDGDTKWLALASWSLNYDYWFSDKLAIGLQNDFILESYFIEHGDEELLERSYPFASVPVLLFKPGKRLILIAGVGAEFVKESTLMMTRLGAEYGFHLPGNWEIGAALVWDAKWNYYNSWGLAFTVSKIWPKKKHKSG
jgi:hypothetical protein